MWCKACVMQNRLVGATRSLRCREFASAAATLQRERRQISRIHRTIEVTFALGSCNGLCKFGPVRIKEALNAAGYRLVGGRQFRGALSRQATAPLGICGVNSRHAADVANQPIVGGLGRVPKFGAYGGHRRGGVFVKGSHE